MYPLRFRTLWLKTAKTVELEKLKVKKLNTKISGSQSGFTLIEIAVVLVIIGLLLGGVLQGQQLIENSRVKSAVNDFNGISAGAFAYQDRYGRLPGDDANALPARGDTWPAASAGNGNGAIASTVATIWAPVDEEDIFFQNLRSAGFVAGDPTQTGANALPQNPFGGLTGLTTDDVGTGATTLGGTKICMSMVSGLGALSLDTKLDDGVGNTGRFWGFINTVAGTAEVPSVAPTAAFDEDETYTVCYRI